MKSFRPRDDERDLESRLRTARPEPHDDLVARLSEHVAEERRYRPGGRLRLGLAMAVTALMAVPFVAFGGAGYAAAAAKQAVESVAPSTSERGDEEPSEQRREHREKPTPAEDQYSNGKQCGHPYGGPKKPNQTPCPPQARTKK